MGRYALVASYYNRNTKKYEREMVVNVLGYDFSKLREIDRFTLDKGNLKMSAIIKEQNDVGDRNFLSIRYVKDSNSTPIYYRVINDNKDLLSCVNDLSLGYGSQRKYTYSIKSSNSFFQGEKDKLIALIESRDYKMLDVLLGNKGYLRFLIDRYLSSYYDVGEQDKKIQDMAEIVLEFSRYKTFRGWIVSNMKLAENRINANSRNTQVNRNNQNSRGNQNKQFKYKKLDAKDFVVDKDMALKDYNQEYEEFLDEEELDEMGIVPSDEESMEMFGDIGKTSKKRRK